MGEIEKLRALLAEAQHALLTKDDDLAASLDARIDAALAKPVSDDFKRGAESMREAAAQNCAGEVCARQIRALPVPEDK